MTEASTSDTPLRASFQVKLNGESVAIATVGQAYRFITRLNTVEWMEFQSLHNDAMAALEAAAEKRRGDDRAGDQRDPGAVRAREVALTTKANRAFQSNPSDQPLVEARACLRYPGHA